MTCVLTETFYTDLYTCICSDLARIVGEYRIVKTHNPYPLGLASFIGLTMFTAVASMQACTMVAQSRWFMDSSYASPGHWPWRRHSQRWPQCRCSRCIFEESVIITSFRTPLAGAQYYWTAQLSPRGSAAFISWMHGR